MKENIASWLLKIRAVFLRPDDPFTWASGIKSPIYCDNRIILSYPEARDAVEKAIAETISREYPECEVLMGTSTAGIPHAAIAATILNKPMGPWKCKGSWQGQPDRRSSGERAEGCCC